MILAVLSVEGTPQDNYKPRGDHTMPRFNTDYTSPSDVQPLELENIDILIFHGRCDELNDLWPSSDRGLLGNRAHVFILNGQNELESAKNLDHYQLLQKANYGRVFAVDERNQMRQIGVTKSDNTGLDIKVSEPLTATDPKAPSFLTYLFSWLISSFGAEVKAYKEQIAFNKQLRAFARDERHPVNLDPNAEQLPLKQTVQEEAVNVAKNANTAAKQPARTKKETLTQFQARLDTYAEYQEKTVGLTLNKKGSLTMEALVERMTNCARRAAAIAIQKEINENPKKKDKILAREQAGFDQMIAEIKAFAPKTIDPADIAAVNKTHGLFRNEKGEVVGQKLDFIGETLLENYRNYVNAGRSDNFLQRRYLTPAEYGPLQKNGKALPVEYCAPYGLSKADPAEVKQPVVQQPVVQQPVAQQPAAKKDPKDMSPEEFKNHLHDAYSQGVNTDIKKVIEHKDFSPEKYYEAVVRIMGGQIAKGMVQHLKGNTDRNAFLNEQKMIYTPLIADLQTFVAEKTDKTVLERYCSGKDRQPDDAKYLMDTAANFIKEGVNKYLEITNAKNAANDQKMQQEQPKNEAKLENEASQKQQKINPLAKV